MQCNQHLISPDDISEIAAADDAYYSDYNSVKLV